MRRRRTLLAPAALAALALTAGAAALPAQTPPSAGQPALRLAPSGRGTSEVTFMRPGAQQGDAAPPPAIRVDYGQPHLRGRTLHTDSLVPYDTQWRTGANAPTTLRTDVDLVLGGTELARGTYVLETLPARAGWTLVVQRPAPAGADTGPEVARIPLRRRELGAPLESLTMWLIPSTQPGTPRGELRIAWGTSELSADWTVR
jgi:hypothetical protein